MVPVPVVVNSIEKYIVNSIEKQEKIWPKRVKRAMLKIELVGHQKDFYQLHFGATRGYLIGVYLSASRYSAGEPLAWVAIEGNPQSKTVAMEAIKILWD